MSRSTTLTVLSPVTGGPYYGELFKGIARVVDQAGGQVVVLQTLDAGHSRDEILRDTELIAPVGWAHCDGVVSVTTAASRPYLERLRAAGKPIVLASGIVEGFDAPTASPDNAGGVRAAVDHLVAHGHQRIGFAGNLVQSDGRERRLAYDDAMRANELEVDPAWLFEAPDNGEIGGQTVARSLLASGVPVTALVFATDRNALGAMDVLAAAGLSVPGDVAVVGFDGIESGSFSTPALSTVSQPFDEVGALAAELAIQQIRGEPVACKRHTVASTFVPRESCGCQRSAGVATAHRLLPAESVPLADQLRELLGVEPRMSAEAAALANASVEFDRAVARTAETAEDVPVERSKALAAAVQFFDPSPEVLRLVAGVLTEHICEAASAARRTAGHAAMIRGAARLDAELWQLQAGAYLDRSTRCDTVLSEHYEVNLHLLDGDQGDLETLDWMSATEARAACLALWDGEPANGQLRVVGVHDPDAVLPCLVGQKLRVEQFPPAGVMARADARLGQMTFVIPVSLRGTDWGLLAVAGEIESTAAGGRATHDQWAALLATGLEQAALRAGIRESEERYSLVARATNDGLWDWNLVDDTVYYSDRCAELLGADREGGTGAASLWFDAVHPDDLGELHEALESALRTRGPVESEHRVRGGDGVYRYLLCRALPVGPEVGPAVRIVGSLSDIDARKRLEEQLRQSALHDEVTGLPNRKLFCDRLDGAIARYRRSGRPPYAVLFIDLDHFKKVNDSCGHASGDRLLATVGRRLQRALREVDVASRFGGDEFALLLHDADRSTVPRVVERIQRMLGDRLEFEGHEMAVTASIGIALSAAHYSSADEVLRDADTAMYEAKTAQRGSFIFFDPARSATSGSEADGRPGPHCDHRRRPVDPARVEEAYPVT